MSYETLDEKIAYLIDQYKQEAEETINNFDLDNNVSSCLAAMIADNVTVLNNIRMEVSGYIEKQK